MKVMVVSGFHPSGHDSAAVALEEEGLARGHLVARLRIWPDSSLTATAVLFDMFRSYARANDDRLPSFLADSKLVDCMFEDLEHKIDLRGYDLVIATHPYAAGILGRVTLERRLCPVVEVHTDWTPFPVVPHSGVALYFGAIPNRGWPSDVLRRQIVTGIPVRSSFGPAPSRSTPRSVLVLAGADGWSPLDRAVPLVCESLPEGWRCEVFAGLPRTDGADPLPLPPNLRIHPRVADLSEALSGASFVVSKPSGLTVAESLVSGAKLILLPSVVPWEAEAARQLASRGLGWPLVDYSDDSRSRLRALFSDARLQEWWFRADGWKLHDATRTIWNACERYLHGAFPAADAAPELRRAKSTLENVEADDLPRTTAWLRVALSEWLSESTETE